MGIFKRVILFHLLISFILLIPVSVYASETKLTTIVPNEVVLNLEIVGSGKVEYHGTYYVRSSVLKIPHNTNAAFTFTPSRGYEISKVTYNGKNQNGLLVNQALTLSDIEPDSVLRVVFSRYGDNPFTGDTFPLILYTGIALLSLIGIIVLIIKLRRL